MKKIIAAVALMMSLAAFADRTLEQLTSSFYEVREKTTERRELLKGFSKAEWISIIDAKLASTNRQPLIEMLVSQSFGIKTAASFSALAEKDEALANSGVMASFTSASAAPMCYANWKRVYGGLFPKTIEYIDGGGSTDVLWKADPMTQLNIAAEWSANFSATNHFVNFDPKWVYKAALSQCNLAVKKALRKQHKSIVTKDGVNPIQLEVDKITAAINSPRMAGLGNAVKALWPEFDWKEPNWPSAAYITELKEKVMDGDMDFKDSVKVVLLYNLGVDEYNKFVKLYNGEE